MATDNFKRFLYKYSSIVDFISASIIICLCLIILLPQVHESFKQQHSDSHPSTNLTVEAHIHQRAHNHSHNFPTGEAIVCAGFFVFYCIGLGLCKSPSGGENQPLVRCNFTERKVSTVCCSSKRCPSSRPDLTKSEAQDETDQAETSLLCKNNKQTSQGDDCVLLLNRHHNHHTHTSHHEHFQPQSNNKHSDYGSTDKNNASPITIHEETIDECTIIQDINIEEIRMASMSTDGDYATDSGLKWPLSARMTLLALLLALTLIVFDVYVNGLMQMMKVFKAASTGALLYVAFFLVLPKDQAGCNSCTREKS